MDDSGKKKQQNIAKALGSFKNILSVKKALLGFCFGYCPQGFFQYFGTCFQLKITAGNCAWQWKDWVN